jgi:hypothetical protein
MTTVDESEEGDLVYENGKILDAKTGEELTREEMQERANR